eukprot:TRINITY_DN28771_c0_g1_i2.p1 TRINITY_DN28771_c0_g1~~TRINITY_DN28771_c0_g1_i2.p1  ORF type:complete len:883 (-),score=146.37 TRINITY_DN28771_c0_g1_i2:96-2618(-)
MRQLSRSTVGCGSSPQLLVSPQVQQSPAPPLAHFTKSLAGRSVTPGATRSVTPGSVVQRPVVATVVASPSSWTPMPREPLTSRSQWSQTQPTPREPVTTRSLSRSGSSSHVVANVGSSSRSVTLSTPATASASGAFPPGHTKWTWSATSPVARQVSAFQGAPSSASAPANRAALASRLECTKQELMDAVGALAQVEAKLTTALRPRCTVSAGNSAAASAAAPSVARAQSRSLPKEPVAVAERSVTPRAGCLSASASAQALAAPQSARGQLTHSVSAQSLQTTGNGALPLSARMYGRPVVRMPAGCATGVRSTGSLAAVASAQRQQSQPAPSSKSAASASKPALQTGVNGGPSGLGVEIDRRYPVAMLVNDIVNEVLHQSPTSLSAPNLRPNELKSRLVTLVLEAIAAGGERQRRPSRIAPEERALLKVAFHNAEAWGSLSRATRQQCADNGIGRSIAVRLVEAVRAALDLDTLAQDDETDDVDYWAPRQEFPAESRELEVPPLLSRGLTWQQEELPEPPPAPLKEPEEDEDPERVPEVARGWPTDDGLQEHFEMASRREPTIGQAPSTFEEALHAPRGIPPRNAILASTAPAAGPCVEEKLSESLLPMKSALQLPTQPLQPGEAVDRQHDASSSAAESQSQASRPTPRPGKPMMGSSALSLQRSIPKLDVAAKIDTGLRSSPLKRPSSQPRRESSPRRDSSTPRLRSPRVSRFVHPTGPSHAGKHGSPRGSTSSGMEAVGEVSLPSAVDDAGQKDLQSQLSARRRRASVGNLLSNYTQEVAKNRSTSREDLDMVPRKRMSSLGGDSSMRSLNSEKEQELVSSSRILHASLSPGTAPWRPG